MSIENCIVEWQKALLDTSKRNKLIKFTHGRAGIFLTNPDLINFWNFANNDNSIMVFPWKKDLLKIPKNLIDQWENIQEKFDSSEQLSGKEIYKNQTIAKVDKKVFDFGEMLEINNACKKSSLYRENFILSDFHDQKLNSILLQLSRVSREMEEERAVSTLFLALGFLKWFETSCDNEEIFSPLILIPIKLSRLNIRSPWQISFENEDPIINPCLCELLSRNFNIKLPKLISEVDQSDDIPDIVNYLNLVERTLSDYPGWKVEEKVAIGNFNFQKLAMWEDLADNKVKISSSPFCLAIAGKSLAIEFSGNNAIKASELDFMVHPKDTNQILIADSSQQEAIERIKRGTSMVIDGPPGTGKSQTIANIIGELMALGKTILFVSEKSAALEIVKKRLDERGLGDFCLELHSSKTKKKDILENLRNAIDLHREKHMDFSSHQDLLFSYRKKLNAYVQTLHLKRGPLNLSPFEIFGIISSFDKLEINSNWDMDGILQVKSDFLDQADEILEKVKSFSGVIADFKIHPWHDCKLLNTSKSLIMELENHLQSIVQLISFSLSINAFEVLNFGNTVSNFYDFLNLIKLHDSLLSLPLLPAHWFSENRDPVKMARLALEIYNLNKKYDENRLRFSCIRDSVWVENSLDNVDSLIEELKLVQTNDLFNPIGEVKDWLVSFEKFQQKSSFILNHVQGLNEVFELLKIHLGNQSSFTIDKAPEVSKALKILSTRISLPKTWYISKLVDEILILAIKAENAFSSNQQIKSKIILNLSIEKALKPENFQTIRDGIYYSKHWWRRFFPAWGEIKEKILSWYYSDIDSIQNIHDDLHNLEIVIQNTSFLQELQESYKDSLIFNKDGTIDWQKNILELKQQQKLLKTLNQPSHLTVSIIDEKSVDYFSIAADKLHSIFTSLENSIVELKDIFLFPSKKINFCQTTDEFFEAYKFLYCSADNLKLVLIKTQSFFKDGIKLSFIDVLEKLNHLKDTMIHVKNMGSLIKDYDFTRIEEKGISSEIFWREISSKAVCFLRWIDAHPGLIINNSLSEFFFNSELKVKSSKISLQLHSLYPLDVEKSFRWLLTEIFPADTPSAFGKILRELSPVELASTCSLLQQNIEKLNEWINFKHAYLQAEKLGIVKIFEELLLMKYLPEQARDVFKKRFFSLLIDEILSEIPELSDFSTDHHESSIQSFKKLDQQSIDVSSAKIRASLLNSDRKFTNSSSAPSTSEFGILYRETLKKRRHLPLRKLFQQIPTILPRLKPCFMMSPLAVSTFLGSSELEFDVVIFDEASQVKPHDAVCALFRGKQLVVAGDPLQLPPTNFFEKTISDDEDFDADLDDGTLAFESLLDVCLGSGMPRQRLKWHYRSKHERLIAFSNYHFYENTLVTFPSPNENSLNPLDFIYLQDGVFENNINRVEAKKVAQMVLEHFKNNPKKSLGVIAFSVSQQNEILNELENLRRESPSMEEYLDKVFFERFFVKNLENVQGDERDFIFLSVGYGPNSSGKVHMRFGPLNQKGGERRLNVAVTRARYGMKVISSMLPDHINLSSTGSNGARILRAFLDYSYRGTSTLCKPIPNSQSYIGESSFELAVYDELTRRGLTLQRHVGCGGFPIDMAVLDEKIQGRYILGIECDGANYLSSATARDRDRLRQQVLESLGWVIVRIWSTDWIQNREYQISRIFKAIDNSNHEKTIQVQESDFATSSLLKPICVIKNEETTPEHFFENIEDVPRGTIETEIQKILVHFGSTNREDLKKTVCQRLGFRRMGTKIDRNIDEVLEELLFKKMIDQDNTMLLSWKSQNEIE